MQNDPRVEYLTSNFFAYSAREATELLKCLDAMGGEAAYGKTHECRVYSTNFETDIDTHKTTGLSYTVMLLDLRHPPQGRKRSFIDVEFTIEQIMDRRNNRSEMHGLVVDRSAYAMKKHRADGHIKGHCMILDWPILWDQMTDFLIKVGYLEWQKIRG